ncbi:PilZ domain-containing protein [Tepidiforma bonchosmolovskayae]|jgi:urease accessory protein UreH|uniref:PilZ domain-containing protein n=1 Tax=Tepidiforma bonchosmolovskayae TaxID=2601677 RepID=A0ABX6C0S7_9CHLR|nr:PilZ domain-containing protein [Tepidiforma bonchosmolovskayae]QFG02711.1 PilZ domain-containing protein [Tepidiforma bonchosmolovskayae]
METFNGVASRRRAPRVPADLPCRLLAGGSVIADGALIDISIAGAAVTVRQPVPATETVVLRLETPGGEWHAEIPARLVTVDPDPFGGLIVRLRFERDPEAARALAPLVSALRRRFTARQADLAGERLGPYGRAYAGRRGA